MDEDARKAKDRERARQRRAVRRAQGRCQNCRVTCAEGSVSRCAGYLEGARRDQRGRDGTPGVRPKQQQALIAILDQRVVDTLFEDPVVGRIEKDQGGRQQFFSVLAERIFDSKFDIWKVDGTDLAVLNVVRDHPIRLVV